MERDHEMLRIEQKFIDMNRQIRELTSTVRALTEKITTSKEGNHQDVLNSETSTRSDSVTIQRITMTSCFRHYTTAQML